MRSRADVTDTQRLARLAVIGALIVPPRLLRAGPTICLLRRVTGRPCPSCGMTRSWNSAAHLRLGEAFRFHPFGPPALIAAVVVAIVPPARLERPELRSARLIVPLGVLWIGVCLARFLRAGRQTGSGA